MYEHEAERELWLLLLRIFYQDIHFSVMYNTIKMRPVRRKLQNINQCKFKCKSQSMEKRV